MFDVVPWNALLGGVLIGAAASAYLIANGKIAGVSGMLGGLVAGRPGGVGRILFLVGLLLAGAASLVLAPESVEASPRPLAVLAVAGLLVGFGTRLAGGCTSGHGVCGVSRLSPRSIVATAVFVGTGMITVTLFRSLGGG